MSKKNIKNKKTAYLAGPMEFDADAGIMWRLEYKEKLEKLGIDCIIPELEEDLITNQVELNILKQHNIEEYIKIMRELIDLDLKFVETSDLIIVNWKGQRMSGTIHEVGYAYQINKPCYLITNQKIEDIPGWFLACFTKIFHSLDKLIEFLKEKKCLSKI